jgi:hypothetical protein
MLFTSFFTMKQLSSRCHPRVRGDPVTEDPWLPPPIVTLEVRRQCGRNDPRGALEMQRGTIDAIADHRLLPRVLGGVWEDGCGHGTTIQSVDNWDVPHANPSSPRAASVAVDGISQIVRLSIGCVSVVCYRSTRATSCAAS